MVVVVVLLLPRRGRAVAPKNRRSLLLSRRNKTSARGERRAAPQSDEQPCYPYVQFLQTTAGRWLRWLGAGVALVGPYTNSRASTASLPVRNVMCNRRRD